MDEGLLPYLVAICSGALAMGVATPLLSVPPAFPAFAVRTMVIVLGGTLLGWWLATRCLGIEP
ncbi:MAG: hypothetical protein ABEH78_07080 [Haloferacaceae archaeon]